MIVIAPDQISEAALNGIIDDFVSRSGRNHDQAEFSVEQMANDVKQQLVDGKLIIVYDQEAASVTLIPAV